MAQREVKPPARGASPKYVDCWMEWAFRPADSAATSGFELGSDVAMAGLPCLGVGQRSSTTQIDLGPRGRDANRYVLEGDRAEIGSAAHRLGLRVASYPSVSCLIRPSEFRQSHPSSSRPFLYRCQVIPRIVSACLSPRRQGPRRGGSPKPTSGRRVVALGYHILYDKVQVWKRGKECGMDPSKRARPDNVAVLHMCNRVGAQHLEDGLGPPLPPNLLEPPPGLGLVLFGCGHGFFLLRAQVCSHRTNARRESLGSDAS